MNTLFREYYGKSIRIAPDGFSLFKREGDRLTAKEYPHSSDALLSVEAPQFFAGNEQVTVISAHHIPMLVPDELYQPEKEKEYLNLQFDTSRLGQTFSDKMGHYQAVYFMTQNDKDTLSRLPFSRTTVAEPTLFYRFLCEQDSETSLFVALNDKFTDILAVNKKEPLFLNRFNLVEPADTLYFICDVIKQFNLHQPDVYLHFFTDENKKLLQLLKAYQMKTSIL